MTLAISSISAGASLARQIKIKVSQATRFQLLYFGGVIPLASLERWHKQDSEGGFKELIDGGEIVGKLPLEAYCIPKQLNIITSI